MLVLPPAPRAHGLSGLVGRAAMCLAVGIGVTRRRASSRAVLRRRYGQLDQDRHTLQTDERFSMSLLSGPAELPELTQAERHQLCRGSTVQKQERNGRVGQGWAAVDVDAPPSVVFRWLASFESYADMIPVVRDARVHSRSRRPDGTTTARCNYKVSKFWINIPAVHTVDESAGLVRFGLDRSTARSAVREADGFWHVSESSTTPGHSRVWLYVGLTASAWLPSWLVDYAAERALRRATGWLKPFFEQSGRQDEPTWSSEAVPLLAMG